jgi:ubiquinone/menaquinone biosynthesis C-methylase UbiE
MPEYENKNHNAMNKKRGKEGGRGLDLGTGVSKISITFCKHVPSNGAITH